MKATDDPWAVDSAAIQFVWPLWAAIAGGSSYALIWLLVGQPALHLHAWFLPIGLVAGVVAALLGPPRQRWTRVLTGISSGWLAGLSASIVATVGLWLTGDTPNLAVRAVVANLTVMAFVGGVSLLILRTYRPHRRLADEVLAQIPSPAATWRRPRKTTVRCRDGTTHSVVILEGGYLALFSRVQAVDVTAIEED